MVFLASLLGDLLSLKKTHTCYCHQIWTAIIKSVREWPRKAGTNTCKGDILFTKPTIGYTKVLNNRSSSEYIRRPVMNFNAKRLCYATNRPHLCIHYLSLLFYLLAYEGPRKKSKTMDAFFSKKTTSQGLFYPFMVPISNNALSEKLKIFIH